MNHLAWPTIFCKLGFLPPDELQTLWFLTYDTCTYWLVTNSLFWKRVDPTWSPMTLLILGIISSTLLAISLTFNDSALTLLTYSFDLFTSESVMILSYNQIKHSSLPTMFLTIACEMMLLTSFLGFSCFYFC